MALTQRYLTLGFSVAAAEVAAAAGAEAKREESVAKGVTGLRAALRPKQLGCCRCADAMEAYQRYLFWRPLCLSEMR